MKTFTFLLLFAAYGSCFAMERKTPLLNELGIVSQAIIAAKKCQIDGDLDYEYYLLEKRFSQIVRNLYKPKPKKRRKRRKKNNDNSDIPLAKPVTESNSSKEKS